MADLCCGIRSITEAAQLHGAKVVAAADKDSLALLQYEHRHESTDTVLFGDISLAVDQTGVGSICQVMQDVDVCVAGTPCSDFSTLGACSLPCLGRARKSLYWRMLHNCVLLNRGPYFRN